MREDVQCITSVLVHGEGVRSVSVWQCVCLAMDVFDDIIYHNRGREKREVLLFSVVGV